MIRTGQQQHVGRRQVLRLGFLAAISLAGVEILSAVVPFLRVQKIVGLGVPVNIGPRSAILAAFSATNDAPILYRQGHFFLLHAPGAIVAAYRKCTHLGCAVPWSAAEDLFHCPCHQSKYDKHTAIVVGGPAPKPLQLFHITETDGDLIVDTNPLRVIDRRENHWDPSVIEIPDNAA